MESWIKPHPQGVTLSLYIRPGASRSEISGLHGDRLKVKIKAPPEDGKANEDLIEFFAALLKIGKSKIELLSGESSRQKILLVKLSQEEFLTSFQSLGNLIGNR